MNKLIPVLLLFSAVQIPAFAQPEYKPITFFYRPSVGAMFATRSFSSNHIPDNLIETKFQNLFCQPLNVGFFYRNIGIEGHLALSPVQNPQTRNSRFLKDIHLQYGDRYYTTISSSVTYDYSGDSSDPLTRGSIGPSYKIEKNRLIFVGRMMVGAVSINTNWGRVRLKEKNTNELLDIDWDTEYPNKDCFSINPSFTFAYRVNRRITFDLDLDSWFYKADVTYVESITNAVSGNVATREYRYNHFMNDISIGLGIMVIFK
jgi:hypothetical protein